MTIRERRDRFIDEAPEGVKELLTMDDWFDSIYLNLGEHFARAYMLPGNQIDFHWTLPHNEYGHERYNDTPSSRQAIYRGMQRIIDIKEWREE